MKTSRGSGFPCASHVPHVLWAITSLGQHVPTCLLAWIQVFWWHRINKDKLLTQLMFIKTFLNERNILTPIWQWDSLQHDGSGSYLSQLWYYWKVWDQLSGHQQPAVFLTFGSIQSVSSHASPRPYWRDRSVCPGARALSVCRGVIIMVHVGLIVFIPHIDGQDRCSQV